jgi:hypothetical protein
MKKNIFLLLTLIAFSPSPAKADGATYATGLTMFYGISVSIIEEISKDIASKNLSDEKVAEKALNTQTEVDLNKTNQTEANIKEN